MKLIYAIVRNDNEDDVTSALNKEGYSVTKLATTGGFLKKGNALLLTIEKDRRSEGKFIVDDVRPLREKGE